jgi:NADH:ubiquinone oxidoreductase subunit 2 (subunit N)
LSERIRFTLGWAQPGLPLTAGFLGKLFVFLGLADHGYWGALSCAVIAAAPGFSDRAAVVAK